jgi:hypothetical protein
MGIKRVRYNKSTKQSQKVNKKLIEIIIVEVSIQN